MPGLSEVINWSVNRTLTKGDGKMLHGAHEGKMPNKKHMLAIMMLKAKHKKAARAKGKKGKGSLVEALMMK